MAEINLEELLKRLEKTTAEEWVFSSPGDHPYSSVQMWYNFPPGGFLHIKCDLTLDKNKACGTYYDIEMTLIAQSWQNKLTNKWEREIICRKILPRSRYESVLVRLYNEAMILSKERKENSIKIFETNYQEWLQEK